VGRPARLIRSVSPDPVLPDVLRPGLHLVICGSAAGTRSAHERCYYAHPGNRFWPVLHEAGLTPRRLLPSEYPRVLEFGIGLTDVCKSEFGADSELSETAYDPDSVRAKVRRYRPRLLAFNGLSPARAVLGRVSRYGLQPTTIGETRVFVVPSTSGLACKHWDAGPWYELGHELRRELGKPARQA
jgi:double-stranded uracil-DNA glycosylase